MEFSKACVDICSSNEIILVHLIYWNRKFGHQWDSPREDNHMSALVPVCWMLKLPGIPKQSEDIWQLCSRLASIGSGAQACCLHEQPAGAAQPAYTIKLGGGRHRRGRRWGEGRCAREASGRRRGSGGHTTTQDTEMFVWQGRRVTLPRRINATCCM